MKTESGIAPESERQELAVDIACVGFGPATGGFLTTLSRAMVSERGETLLESQAMPGMPLQVVCYERADDLGFGVSGVVTRARGIRESFPDLDPAAIPRAQAVIGEKLVYLRDPHGASRRAFGVRVIDTLARTAGRGTGEHHAVEIPHVPSFLSKENGLLFTIGQFNQWVAGQLMGTGLVQLWPGTAVAEPLIEGDRVTGVRLIDQGTDRHGQPGPGYLPGMNIRAALTVVGDGPIGPVGQRLDHEFGVPEGYQGDREWAVGMKMLVELPAGCALAPGTVIHTIGYPEPEIFGFLYVFADQTASLGIFVPSWFASPVRASYRYLQHWMRHPYLWRHLEGGTMRSWGAKTLNESGRRGQPHLAGNGYARIGEGSGSTNVLTGSGVDEAWTTGVLLARGVIELVKAGRPFTRENLEESYVARRRRSWVEHEARAAEEARNGFQHGVVRGLFGMGLAGLTGGRLHLPSRSVARQPPSLEEHYRGRIAPGEIRRLRTEAEAAGTSLADALMARSGWPAIPLDGKLLVSHQDALLIGGKVQAPPGYADHVVFVYPHLCERCENRLCIEVCSGQAITPGANGAVPDFDREKCVHCGACVWNCTQRGEDNDPSRRGNIRFSAGTGGLHSVEN